LKEALFDMLGSRLSVCKIRGQGYDGASNMRGEFNGLQKLIRDESPYAFYIHCFAHQLQLVVVTVASSSRSVSDFFNQIPLIVNSMSSSCKRMDALLAKQQDVLLQKLESGNATTGTGQHQEMSLARPSNTRWGSHLKTLLRIYQMWEAVIEVLEIVSQDASGTSNHGEASGLIQKMESFEFVFIMHFMIDLLGVTNELSLALQRSDQDIVEAMGLLEDVKMRLQDMRDNGWTPLFQRVKSFCETNAITVPDMEELIPVRGKSARRNHTVTHFHYYHVEIFIAAIDAITSEMNHRFNECSSKLLVCMSCLDPRNSFSKFDVDKLVRLAEIYADDFTMADHLLLRNQLQTFILNIRRSVEFHGCGDVAKLAEKMVETGKNRTFPLVYRLIELTLILLVATESVERIFSAMNIIKTDLRNRVSNEWFNDLMICYTERKIFQSLDDRMIMERFQAMNKRRMALPTTHITTT
jgi:hypothetical protein